MKGFWRVAMWLRRSWAWANCFPSFVFPFKRWFRWTLFIQLKGSSHSFLFGIHTFNFIFRTTTQFPSFGLLHSVIDNVICHSSPISYTIVNACFFFNHLFQNFNFTQTSNSGWKFKDFISEYQFFFPNHPFTQDPNL